MIKKLLKYDFGSIKRIWWLVAIAVPAVTFFGAIALRVFTEITDFLEKNQAVENEGVYLLFAVFAMLLFLGSFLIVSSSLIVTTILVHVRFFKNLYTDQGYLTFTLPVKRSELLLSKTINSFFWETLHFILVAVSSILYFVIAPPTGGDGLLNLGVYREPLGYIWEALTTDGGFFWAAAYIIVLVLLFACIEFFSVSLAEFCITVGAVIVNKCKLLVGVGIYYAISTAISVVAQIIGTVIPIFMLPTYVEYMLDSGVVDGNINILSLLVITAAATAIVAMSLYFATLNMMERKLNLP
ncbi:MAG: hypothetical protein J6Q68_03105 [Clostridia bacterium]|nr:hypothetical protein [Clostridia bacterium]